MRTCAISVDLDEIHHYAAIHGVTANDVNTHAVYDVAVRRLMDFAEAVSIPLTLFTVAADLYRADNVAVLREAVARGHEISNHSLNHHYDLTRLQEAEMRQEVASAIEVIEQRVGVRPTGFRAPGYTTNDRLYRILSEEGVQYSSSVFPCPAYYAAKVTAIALKRLRGRRSASVVDDPRVLFAPTKPYHVAQPYWRRGQGTLLELPIQTTPGWRLPYVGTFLTWWGPRFAHWATCQLTGQDFINLELHGIDVLDRDDGLEALAAHQYDVRVPLARKLSTLRKVVLQLKQSGYVFQRLDEVAKHLLG